MKTKRQSAATMATPHLVIPAFARCDACPAPATVAVRLRSHRDLVLCGSHARRHEQALFQQGAAIVGDYSFEAAVVTARRVRSETPPKPQEQSAETAKRWWQRLRRGRAAARPPLSSRGTTDA